MRLLLLLMCLPFVSNAQDLLDYQLRLEPVWSRVADALGEAGSVESAEFSPDGRFIVSGTKYDNSVVMWRTSDGMEIWRQYTEQEVERVGWSADGKYVAGGSEDYLVTVYDAASGKEIKRIPHNQGIDGLTWSNQGHLLATGEEYVEDENGQRSGYLHVTKIPEGEVVAEINYGSTINELSFTLDDRYLVAAGHNGVKVYETENWTLVRDVSLAGQENIFTAVNFSPDGKYLIAAQNKPIRGSIVLIDWKADKIIRSFSHTGKKVETIAWHPNGDYIAFAGHDPYIYTYRVSDLIDYKGDRIRIAARIWAGDHAEYIDFNADGSFLVSAHQNGLIKLWAWMGEDPDLNDRRHQGVKEIQERAAKNND